MYVKTALVYDFLCILHQESAWKKDVGYLAPFDGITEALRAKMEIAAKPKEEVEEERRK